MVAKPKGCQGCPLSTTGHGYVLPTIPDWSKVDLIVVGEAPGSDEVDEGQPFVGRAGKQMHMVLRHVSIDPKRVYYDNVLRCLPPLNKSGEYYPVGKDRVAAEQHCKQYDQIALAPKHIPMLLVGNKAMNKYMGQESLTDWHGSIDIIDGRMTMATYHPSAVLRNMNLITVVVSEVQNLVNKSRDGKLPEVPWVHQV